MSCFHSFKRFYGEDNDIEQQVIDTYFDVKEILHCFSLISITFCAFFAPGFIFVLKMGVLDDSWTFTVVAGSLTFWVFVLLSMGFIFYILHCIIECHK